MKLKDKVVLITGSTRGIGAATAIAFAKQGCKVIINGRKEMPAELKEKLDSLNTEYVFIQADLMQEDQIKSLAKQAWDAFGVVDVLVNNAGINRDKLFIAMKDEDFDQVMDVNVRAPFMLTQALLKKMFKKRSGSIINLASVVGLHGNAGQANYATSKAAIVGFTKAVAQEAAMRNIRCNAVAPGMIATDMTAKLSDRVQKQIVDAVPLKRFGDTQEVAQAIIFLAQNDYITGQTIVVDGGMTM